MLPGRVISPAVNPSSDPCAMHSSRPLPEAPRRDAMAGSRAWSHGAASKADDERALLPPGASAPCAFKGAATGNPRASHRPLFEIASRRLGASPEAKATGSGSVGPKPARSRLDQFFLGRRADGFRLVPGLFLGRPGVVKAERRPWRAAAGCHRVSGAIIASRLPETP